MPLYHTISPISLDARAAVLVMLVVQLHEQLGHVHAPEDVLGVAAKEIGQEREREREREQEQEQEQGEYLMIYLGSASGKTSSLRPPQ